MDHSAHHGHHVSDLEWDTMAAHLEREGEVMLPTVTETASWVTERCRQDGFEVRRILEIGSGPGVASCALARCFPSATVLAVDGSAALLERAAARAEAAGLSDRVAIRRADLPEGLADLEPADVIWASMVLHHIGDEAAALRELRALLNPGGLLVVIERGEPMRFLPDEAGVGRPGLADRLDAAQAAWLAAMREGLPHATPSRDYPTMLEAAGYDLIADHVAHVRLDPPLGIEVRQIILADLQRTPEIAGEWLDQQDRDAIDVLIDEQHPLGIMQRPDVFLDASRHIYIARAAVATDG